MSAPADPSTAQTSFRLPRSLLARLKATAADRQVGVNRLVVAAITEHLDRLAPAPSPVPEETTDG